MLPTIARWFIIRVRTTSTGLEAMAPASPHVKLELYTPNQGRDSRSPQLVPQGTGSPARVPGAAQVTQTWRHPLGVHSLPTRANTSLGRREEEQGPEGITELPVSPSTEGPVLPTLTPKPVEALQHLQLRNGNVKKDFGVLCQPCPEQADCNTCSGSCQLRVCSSLKALTVGAAR